MIRFAAVCVFGTCAVVRATTYYVDASQAATSPPWNGAYAKLQDAIAAAAPFDIIKVAQGVYRPDDTAANPTTGDRTATFELKVNVTIEGGYRGGATNPNDWDPDLYVTVLTGDLDPTDIDRKYNSLIVVTAMPDINPDGFASVLRGVTVEDGHHFESKSTGGADGDGAGIVIRQGRNPRIERCKVRNCTVPKTWQDGGGNNQTGVGAGILIETDNINRQVDLSETLIELCEAGEGGGLCVRGETKVELTACTIQENVATANNTGGGGFSLLEDTNVTILGCQIVGNQWTGLGSFHGAGGRARGAELAIRDCLFQENEGGTINVAGCYGGGLSTELGSTTIVNSVFEANHLGCKLAYGSGLYVDADTKVFNSIFRQNSGATSTSQASRGGGIMSTGRGVFTNLLLHGNEASKGGAIATEGSPIIANCTVVGNTAELCGGIFCDASSSAPTIVNSIIWDNSDALPDNVIEQEQIHHEGNPPAQLADVRYSCIQDDLPGDGSAPYNTLTSMTNIDIDPAFVGTGLIPYRLDIGSPCIDTGSIFGEVPDDAGDVDLNQDDMEATPLDLVVGVRFVDGAFVPGAGGAASCESRVDMGMHEFSDDFVSLTGTTPNGIPDGEDLGMCLIDPACDITDHDSNRNGIFDILEDCDTDGTPDPVQIALNPETWDCNGNCVLDGCESVAARIEATVRLDGVSLGTNQITRCIRFIPMNGEVCGDPIHVMIDFTGTPAQGTVSGDELEIECGTWTALCVKDEQHTLSDQATLSISGTGPYAFVAVSTLNLLGGDTDNDDDIDMDDVHFFISTFSTLPNPNSANCPWSSSDQNADFSNNGHVGGEDYTWLSDNWEMSADCCSHEEAPLMGGFGFFGESSSDLNGDGVFDVDDVEMFEVMYGLDGSLSAVIRASAD